MDPKLLVWCVVVAIGFIIGIIQICALCRFLSLRSLFVITKRFPKLIMIESTAVIIYTLLVFPFQFDFNLESAIDLGNMDTIISFLFAIPFMFFILLIETVRLWLISYNLHYLKASKNEKWKSLIDQNIVNKDWYIRNKNKYGNPKKVVVVAMIYWLFEVIVVDIAYYKDFEVIGNITFAIVWLMDMIPPYVIFYKCRNYKQLKDNLLFFYEFKATICVWSVGILLYAVAEAVEPLGGPKLLEAGLYGFISIFCLSAASLVSTIWIPYKFSSVDRGQSIVFTQGSTNAHELVKSSSIELSPDKQKLFGILKNEQQFETFIQFMFRDFSSEAMLGYIEMVQFKECFVEEMGIKDNSCRYMGSLYENVPKSSIVYDGKADKKGIERMKEIASKLCEKYIRRDSKYEVNISWRLRHKLLSLNDSDWKMETDDFLSVFDKVLDDLFRFMRQSFHRFNLE